MKIVSIITGLSEADLWKCGQTYAAAGWHIVALADACLVVSLDDVAAVASAELLPSAAASPVC